MAEPRPRRPCPFCGDEPALRQRTHKLLGLIYYVSCANELCDMRGPSASTATTAVALWDSTQLADQDLRWLLHECAKAALVHWLCGGESVEEAAEVAAEHGLRTLARRNSLCLLE